MILHSDQEGNECLRKLRCHCIQIMHSDIYSVLIDNKKAENHKASCFIGKGTTDNRYQRDTLVQQSVIILALLTKFVYEHRRNRSNSEESSFDHKSKGTIHSQANLVLRT